MFYLFEISEMMDFIEMLLSRPDVSHKAKLAAAKFIIDRVVNV